MSDDTIEQFGTLCCIIVNGLAFRTMAKSDNGFPNSCRCNNFVYAHSSVFRSDGVKLSYQTPSHGTKTFYPA